MTREQTSRKHGKTEKTNKRLFFSPWYDYDTRGRVDDSRKTQTNVRVRDYRSKSVGKSEVGEV